MEGSTGRTGEFGIIYRQAVFNLKKRQNEMRKGCDETSQLDLNKNSSLV